MHHLNAVLAVVSLAIGAGVSVLADVTTGLDPNVVIAAIPGILAAFVSYLALRQATKAKEHAADASDKATATGQAVDGVLHEFIRASSGQARAEGELVGQQAQRDRQSTPEVQPVAFVEPQPVVVVDPEVKK